MPFSHDYLRFENDDPFDFSITTKINRKQMLPFNSKLVKDYKVFDEFGKLLNPKYDSEMEKLIKNSIIFYSKCISETDLHLRISQLIMIVESIFYLMMINTKWRINQKEDLLTLYLNQIQ